jgi:hypothetical protein
MAMVEAPHRGEQTIPLNRIEVMKSACVFLAATLVCFSALQADTPVRGVIIDAATKQPVAARLYLQSADGKDYFPTSAGPEGRAVIYQKQNWINKQSVERHTSLTAHPWSISLPPGRYTAVVERGKEYRTHTHEFTVGGEPVSLELPLQRWVNMAERGWYSGDTHLHRPIEELEVAALAEDLNVSFPMTYWTTLDTHSAAEGNKNLAEDAARPAELIQLDKTHVIWPRNTEWEINRLSGQQHTLGALFALNHRRAFDERVPPLGPAIAAAKADGALFDTDKADWLWGALMPHLLEQPLFELANNHMWRTEFGFTKWNTAAPEWMGLPGDGKSGAEKDWMEFTHRSYWTLLNCGFRGAPTAGTASGVHPVMPGYGRVYVRLKEGFSYENWLRGLTAGRSFVTTGPMLIVDASNQKVTATLLCDEPPHSVEIIVNGEIVKTITPQFSQNTEGAWESLIEQPLTLEGTSWVAVRAWESREKGSRWRFAHSAPVWFEVAGQPLRPRKREIDYLLARARQSLETSGPLLAPEARAEYVAAIERYAAIAKTARE